MVEMNSIIGSTREAHVAFELTRHIMAAEEAAAAEGRLWVRWYETVHVSETGRRIGVRSVRRAEPDLQALAKLLLEMVHDDAWQKPAEPEKQSTDAAA